MPRASYYPLSQAEDIAAADSSKDKGTSETAAAEEGAEGTAGAAAADDDAPAAAPAADKAAAVDKAAGGDAFAQCMQVGRRCCGKGCKSCRHLEHWCMCPRRT